MAESHSSEGKNIRDLVGNAVGSNLLSAAISAIPAVQKPVKVASRWIGAGVGSLLSGVGLREVHKAFSDLPSMDEFYEVNRKIADRIANNNAALKHRVEDIESILGNSNLATDRYTTAYKDGISLPINTGYKEALERGLGVDHIDMDLHTVGLLERKKELDPIANKYNTGNGQRVRFGAKVGNAVGDLTYAGALAAIGGIGDIAIRKGFSAIKDRLNDKDDKKKKNILSKILGAKGNG